MAGAGEGTRHEGRGFHPQVHSGVSGRSQLQKRPGAHLVDDDVGGTPPTESCTRPSSFSRWFCAKEEEEEEEAGGPEDAYASEVENAPLWQRWKRSRKIPTVIPSGRLSSALWMRSSGPRRKAPAELGKRKR